LCSIWINCIVGILTIVSTNTWFPRRSICADVKGCSGFILVKVINHEISQELSLRWTKLMFEVRLMPSCPLVLEGAGCWDGLWLVEVQDVPVSKRIVNLRHVLVANRRLRYSLEGHSGKVTFVINNFFSKLLTVECSIVCNIYSGWESIIGPIGTPISNQKSSKLNWIWSLSRSVSIHDSPSQKGNINTSIAFSSKVKRMILVFWKLFKPSLNKFVVVHSISDIVETAVFYFFYAFAESNCCRVLKVDNTCIPVPGKLVYLKLVCTINLKWSNFRNKAYHWGACRASVRPKDEWICFRIALGLGKNVMQPLFISFNFNLSGIHSKRKSWHFRHWKDLISCWFSLSAQKHDQMKKKNSFK